MDKASNKLTVFFEDPFWVGVFEKYTGDSLSVVKVTLGAEPKDYEINDFIQRSYYSLNFSPAVKAHLKEAKKNPKRLMREAKKQTLENGIGTKSQLALKLQQEENKLERKAKSRQEREAEAERLFEIKQQKRKEKHRGH